MSAVLHYSMHIAWSEEDQVYVVSVPEWGELLHTHGESDEEALHQGKELIAALIASRQQHGEPLPPPQLFTNHADVGDD